MSSGPYKCAVALVSALTFAPASLADVATLPGTPEQQRLFLAGAAAGIAYMNLSGSSRVFCEPADFILSGDVVRAYADRGLTGEHDPETFVMVAILELREEFPCPWSRYR
jgi:hypothetical protein